MAHNRRIYRDSRLGSWRVKHKDYAVHWLAHDRRFVCVSAAHDGADRGMFSISNGAPPPAAIDFIPDRTHRITKVHHDPRAHGDVHAGGAVMPLQQACGRFKERFLW